MQKIRIKYFTDKIDKLEYIEGKSDWIDLRASETVELKAGEFKLIPLGVAMELPKGYEAHVVPRSSTFKNYGILQTNSCGIIDCTYCGDEDMWRMPVYATRDTVIKQNDRICQFRIFENMPTIQFDETASLESWWIRFNRKTIDSSICTGTWINFVESLHSNYAGIFIS